MKRLQYSLKSLLVVMAAIPVWLFVVMLVGGSVGWGKSSIGYVMAAISLVGSTLAIHRLLPKKREAWAFSALIAGTLILVALFVIAGISQWS